MAQPDDLPPEVFELFRDEAREDVEKITRGLERLESGEEKDPSKAVREIARSLHSLKGNSASMGFDELARVAHAAEDALMKGGAGREGLVTRAAAWIESTLRGEPREAKTLLDELRAAVPAAPEGLPLPSTPSPRPTVSTAPAASASAPRPSTPLGLTGSARRNDPSGPPAASAPVPVTPASPPPETASGVRSSPSQLKTSTPTEKTPTTGFGTSVGREGAVADESVRVRLRTVEALLGPLAVLAGERTQSRFRGERLKREAETARALLRSASQGMLSPGELEELEGLVGALEREGRSARASAHAMARSVAQAEELVQRMRLVSVGSLKEPLRLAVRDAASRTNKQVRFELLGGEVMMDRRALDELRAPLLHLVRNAVDHGLEGNRQRLEVGKRLPSQLTVTVVSRGEVIDVSVKDDGKGVDAQQVAATAVAKGLRTAEQVATLGPDDVLALLTLPGFSTREAVTDVSGRGVGLDVVALAVRTLGGALSLETTPGQGTTFTLSIPVSVLSTRVLFVRVGRQTLALPLSSVEVTERLPAPAFYEVGGRRFATVGAQAVPLHELDAGRAAPTGDARAVTLRVKTGAGAMALVVDEVLGEEEVSVQPLGPPLRRVGGIVGATLAESGEVVVVLDPRSLGRLGEVQAADEARDEPKAARVLVVDDSITTRTLERHIFERAGYLVDLARDGLEALAALKGQRYDVVVTDFEMPNLDGIGLVRAMRSDEASQHIPAILVTSVTAEETRRRAMAAGANAYIGKGRFDQDTLLKTVAELLGKAALP